MPTVDHHGPPADLDVPGRKLYLKLRKFLKDAGLWENSDKFVLGQTCRYEQRSRLALASLPVDTDGRPILTTQGRSEFSGEVQHPLVRIIETADRGFLDGLRELGLTPRARKQLDVEPKKSTGRLGL